MPNSDWLSNIEFDNYEWRGQFSCDDEPEETEGERMARVIRELAKYVMLWQDDAILRASRKHLLAYEDLSDDAKAVIDANN